MNKYKDESVVKDVLYCASQSASRQMILQNSGICYKLLEHSSDEQVPHPEADFRAYVLAIAHSKLKTVILPQPSEHGTEPLFVLTADTLVRTQKTLQILGKPRDKDHGRHMLMLVSQEPIEVVTGCCLEKMVVATDGQWKTVDAAHWTTEALVEYIVAPELVDEYFNTTPIALYGCGASIVEGYGQNFLKSVHGSYTAVLGLPLFELRKELERLHFRF